MDKLIRLFEIIETYGISRAKLESRGIGFGPTEENGFWTTSQWKHIIPFFEWAVKNDVIYPSGPVVDAGSGTGEPSTVFDVYGFSPVVNIELSGELIEAANETIDTLVSGGIVKGDIRTVQGDFTQDAAYEAAGVAFTDVMYFYHGINQEPLKTLAERIKEESPEGTKLIVHGMFDDIFSPDVSGLTLGHKFRTPDLMADFYVYGK